MDAGAPGERSNQHGEPRRSLEGLDCLGMLPATPANMRQRAAHGGGRPLGIGNAPAPRSAKEEPRRGGSNGLRVTRRQSVSPSSTGASASNTNMRTSASAAVQHFHEGLRHALGPVLLPQLFGGDALDMLQVRIRQGVATSFTPTAGL